MKTWLFSEGNHPPVTLLKEFIKSQVYRPLYFKHDNYSKFTSNESKYWIATDKYFIPYGEEKRKLVLNGTVVDSAQSEFHDNDKRSFSGFNYSPGTNHFSYDIKYAAMDISANKFVHEDIEYFVVRSNGEDDVALSIFFNKFQKQMQSAANQVTINNGRFELNKVKFQIAGNVLEVDPTTGFDPDSPDDYKKYQEYRQEIVDNMFCIEGVWYLIVGNKLRYAKVDDSLLVKVQVSDSSPFIASYEDLRFEFVDNWTKVVVTRHYDTIVHDKVASETCAYDRSTVSIDENRTFEWNFANVVKGFKDDPALAAQWQRLQNLGKGMLFDGLLDVTIAS